MADEHLSDHEWKLKMAAEGKAIYIPGKTTEQVKAEMAQKERAQNEQCKCLVEMPFGTWKNLPDALSEAVYALRNAQDAFDHVHQALSDSAASDPGLMGLIELSSRGLRHVAENEGELLDDVEFVIREAVSRLAEHKANTKSKERKS